MILVTLTLTLTLGGLELRGDTPCPTVQAVAAELGELVGSDGAQRTVELSSHPDGLRLDFRDAAGRLEAVRTLPLGRCEALARASAVAIATWAAQPHEHAPAREAPRPTAEAPKPAERAWRVFAPATLETERMRATQLTYQEPPHLRGPLLTFIAATVVQLAGLSLTVAPSSMDTNTKGALVGVSAVLSLGSLLGGVVWLAGLESGRQPGTNFVF